MWQNSYDDSSSLYLVPTPIGNMEDITYRAINVLKMSEVIFSEDTRVTLKLLNYYNIKKKLISLHEHNEDTIKEKVLEYLKDGYNVSLVTDRGTPIISDPGYKTVSYVSKMGYNVISLPGATAFVPALCNSGISSNHFLFYGFLDSKTSKCRKELMELKNFPYTIIFYEAPHRIHNTLNVIFDVFGDRIISISREISKKYESVFRGSISQFLNDPGTIKGEYVIVVQGFKDNIVFDISVCEQVDNFISDGMDVMTAIKETAKLRGKPKNDIYKEYHTGRRK